MAFRARVEPISRDIEVLIREELSPEAQSEHLAGFAREQLKEAQSVNRAALGRVPKHDTFVDGREGAPIESVRPDGRIVFEFELLEDVLRWIGAQLVLNSPRLTGQYSRSHAFFADGVEVAMGAVLPDAGSYEFVNTVPYSRKIERGLSPQAPDGVYQTVAAVASRRFGNIARIRFTYRTIAGDVKNANTRQPAIVVTL